MVGKKNMNYENIRRITAKPENVFCPMSKSPSGKREGFQDNATRKKRYVYY